MKNHNVWVKKLAVVILLSFLLLNLASIFIKSTLASSATAEKVADILDGEENDVFIKGNFAYIASGQGGLRIYNIMNPSAPTLESELDEIGNIRGIYVKDNFAYLAAGEDGLLIVDISDFSTMSIVASYPSGGGDAFANEIEVEGDYLFLAEEGDGVEIFDISDPMNPHYLSSYDSLTVRVSELSVNGSYLYIANYYYPRIDVLDISNIYFPTRISSYSDDSGWIDDLCVMGDYVLVLDDNDGLEVLNLTDPYHPTEIGNYTTLYSVHGICENGTHAFISSSIGFKVFDLTDPSNPLNIGSYGNYGSSHYGNSMCYHQGIVYAVSSYVGGFSIFDVSNPYNPQIISEINDTMGIDDFRVEGNTAYVAGVDGIISIDIDNPHQPNVSDKYESRYLHTIESSPGYCYTHYDEELIVLNSSTLSQNGSYSYSDHVYNIRVQFPYAIMFHSSSLESVFILLNVTDPTHPTLLYEHHISGNIEFEGAEIEEELLFIIYEDWFSDSDSLLIFDISNATNPIEIIDYNVEGPRDVCVVGEKVYIAEIGGLKILDVSIPADPQVIGQYELHYTVDPYGIILCVEVVNEVAYIGAFTGVVIVDVFDLEDINMLAYFKDGPAFELQYHEGYLYFTSSNDGLEILKVNLDLSDRNKIPGYSIFLITIFSVVSLVFIANKRFSK